MGSGCNTSGCGNMFEQPINDTRIKYTGPPIPALGICTNDYLNEVEATLLQQILNFASGQGINISSIDLSTCDAFKDCITCCNNSCTDLPCLLDCYKNAICSIFTDVATLKTEIDTLLNGPYNTACLKNNLPTNPTLNQIIQELILEFCTLLANFNTLQTTVSGITANLSTNIGNFLLSAITTCTGTGSVIKSGTGATASIAFKGFVPVGGIIPYGGVTAGKFDSTGLGLAGTDMCGWALANGNNSTVNMMGQVPVGLTNMGGSLPSNASGLSVTVSGAQGGVANQALTSTSIPSVSVSVSGTHTHDITGYSDCKSTTSNSNNIWVLDVATVVPGTCPVDSTSPPYNIPHTFSGKISSVTQTLTGSIAGGGTSPTHNNMQPYTGLLYIQRIN